MSASSIRFRIGLIGRGGPARTANRDRCHHPDAALGSAPLAEQAQAECRIGNPVSARSLGQDRLSIGLGLRSSQAMILSERLITKYVEHDRRHHRVWQFRHLGRQRQRWELHL